LGAMNSRKLKLTQNYKKLQFLIIKFLFVLFAEKNKVEDYLLKTNNGNNFSNNNNDPKKDNK